MSIDLDLPRKIGPGTLPADVRQDIRAKVASDVWRVGIGSALIVLFIPLFIMLVIAKYYIGRSRRAITTRPMATMSLPRIASRMTAKASWPTVSSGTI